jgi:hypothetical protein
VLFYLTDDKIVGNLAGVGGLTLGSKDEGTEEKKKSTGEEGMWISLFTLACGAAICLSVAGFLLQPAVRGD